MVLALAPEPSCRCSKGPPGPTDCHRCWVMTNSGNPDIKWWSEQMQKGRIGLYLQIIGYELPCQAKTSQTERICIQVVRAASKRSCAPIIGGAFLATSSGTMGSSIKQLQCSICTSTNNISLTIIKHNVSTSIFVHCDNVCQPEVSWAAGVVLASAPGASCSCSKGPPGPTDCHRCWVMTNSGNPDIK